MNNTTSNNIDGLIQEAVAAHQQGRLVEAVAGYRAALKDRPADADLYHLLGLALFQQGEQAEGEKLIRTAIGIEGRQLFWFNLGRCLNDIGQAAEAEQAYRSALQLDPGHVESLENLARILVRQQRHIESVPLMERAVKVRPNSGSSWSFLGYIYRYLHNSTGARAAFFHAWQQLQKPELLWKTLLVMPSIYSSETQISDARNDLLRHLPLLGKSAIADPAADITYPPFPVGYHHQGSREIIEPIARVLRECSPLLNYTARHCRPESTHRPDGRWRIGFLSGHLREHSVTEFYGRLIETIPHERWESWAITPAGAVKDSTTERLTRNVDHLVEIDEQLELAQQQLAALELDLLVWVDIGMDTLPWFLAFGRYAPVQVVLPGHPLTSGIDTIDYYLSHPGCEPADAASRYTEQLVLLPEDSTYVDIAMPEAVERLDRAAFALPESGAIYLCPQMLMKIHPRMDEWFHAILERDRSGWLVLIVVNEQHKMELDQRLKTTLGAYYERLVWLKKQSSTGYRQLLLEADVMLDSWPFSGGRSTFDIIANEVPVVTLPGPEMRGRQTAHLLRRIGLEELIAETPNNYVEMALRIAREPAWRSEVKRRMHENKHRIFNDSRAVAASHEQFAAWVSLLRHG